MRRGLDHPFSVPRHAPSLSAKRRDSGQFQAPPQPHSSYIIDQRLIEGAQAPALLGISQRQASHQYQPRRQFPSSLVDDYENIQLDAFDLELLAQSDGSSKTFQSSTNTEHCSTYRPDAGSLPNQVSRFFDNSQVTPLRSVNSNSSDADIRDTSSPLARIQNGRVDTQLRDQGLERRRASQVLQPQSPIPYVNKESHIPSTVPQDHKTPFQNIPVSIRGIVLLSVRELPDNYRSIFHFPVFNAVQSKCFQSIYNSDDNFVLAAPTGSGKTVVMELAICRMLNTLKDERFKVVYQAPTKSLCSERFRDWNRKFHSLGLQCAELTGDTDNTQLRNVQNSQIIITTPEKWDSMTRKWKDHARLMQLVKLFLIDEVHTLKEARGATLEAVVSRMKSFGSNVRFVALSATIPNSEDIATWLGRSATNQHVPAHREHFGEEFRPVKLQRFVYGYQSHSNDFAFDKMCNSKLPEMISTHSCRKPIMIFCCTRNSAVATAKELARLWSMSNPPARLWKGPNRPIGVNNIDLKNTTSTGVAFHHAGLDPGDRHQVENGFLEGQISIICCTSTLAVGVNLPCHLVIIKNTVGWQDGCCQEYSDLEIMQMLGRAGRPQFDDSAAAVILTRKERVNHYERLVSGSESLESCLHLNLIDHLNAEIGLGNVTSIESAITWLAGTFLFVRLRRNPTHYQLREGANRDDEDEMLRQICEKDIKLLQECGLVTSEGLRSTQYGDAMARYYIRFETMKKFLTLEKHPSVSQILSVISEADEFRDVRLKAGERSLYKEINRSSDIQFHINVDIALPAHKISLLIQSELGAVEFPSGEQYQKHRFPFQQDKNSVFSHVNRLIRCIIDCQVVLEDSVAVQNALELARSFASKVWDNSPLQLKQIEQIGVVAVRKLAAAGIDTIDTLADTEPHHIDMILSKNPPFGVKLRGRLSEFPRLRVSMKMMGKDIKPSAPVKTRFRAEIAFMNEKCPTFFQRRPIHVCFLAETSDGRLIDFRRISASKIKDNQEIPLIAELKHADQFIRCHVMCDEIAGTLRSAVLKADLPCLMFPKHPRDDLKARACPEKRSILQTPDDRASKVKVTKHSEIDDFDSDDFLFGDFLEADVINGFQNKESYKYPQASETAETKSTKKENMKTNSTTKPTCEADREPTRPDNDRWACNHKCKDKLKCKHLCCKEGLKKPPKTVKKCADGGGEEATGLSQLTLSASMSKRRAGHLLVKDVLGQDEGKYDAESLDSNKTRSRDFPSTAFGGVNSKNTKLMENTVDSSSDYGDAGFDDIPSPSALFSGSTIDSKNSTDSQNVTAHIGVDKHLSTIPEVWTNGDEVPWPSKTASVELSGRKKNTKENCLVNLVSPEPQDLYEETAIIQFANNENRGGAKRKLSVADESGLAYRKIRNKENNEKRDSVLIKRGKDVTAANAKDKVMIVPQVLEVPTLPSIPAGWGDIDPALLDEFKDIVDFF